MKPSYNFVWGIAQAAITSTASPGTCVEAQPHWQPLAIFAYSARQLQTSRTAGVFLAGSGATQISDDPSNQRSPLAVRFQELATKWQDETWFMSNADSMAKHPAYQEIIRMGKPALPFILHAMQQEPDHWFWALNLITNFDAVQVEHAGNIPAMTQDWLDWGRKHQLL